jgi:adenosine deaminase
MAKIDLHVHLNGCFTYSDLWRLAQKYDLSLEHFEKIFSFHTFPEFSEAWKLKNSLVRTYADFSFLIDGVVDYLKKEHIIYREPAIALFEFPPLDPAKLLDIVTKKLNASGIHYSFIMDLIRGDGAKKLTEQYNFYNSLAKHYPIRGVGLAGNEEKHGLSKDLIPIFAKAKEDGYGTTIHAGEMGQLTNIESAINDFHVDRIGHANQLNLNIGPSLAEEIIRGGQHLEFQPSSFAKRNKYQSIYKFKKHFPTEKLKQLQDEGLNMNKVFNVSSKVKGEIQDYLRADLLNRMYDAEIPLYNSFSVGSDDPGMFRISLSEILDHLYITNKELKELMLMANGASFAPKKVKESIKTCLLKSL